MNLLSGLFQQRPLNCLKDCNGACCHDMTISVLGENELKIFAKLKQRGLKVTVLEEQPDFPAGHYLVEGDCPARNKGKGGKGCADYYGERLRACHVTECGAGNCPLFRERDGYSVK